MLNFDDFANELILAILNRCDAVSLYRLSQTCCRLNSIVNPLLFRAPAITSVTSWIRFTEALQSNKLELPVLVEELDLNGVENRWEKLGNHAFAPLFTIKLDRLRLLDLGHCSRIHDKTIIALSDVCANLTTLSLAHCKRLTNKAVVSLSKCKKLQSLDLSFVHSVSDGSILYLVKQLELRWLNLEETAITDKCAHACLALPSIQYLNINGCYEILDPVYIAENTRTNCRLVCYDLYSSDESLQ